jgi:hypothetical protein
MDPVLALVVTVAVDRVQYVHLSLLRSLGCQLMGRPAFEETRS